ncbi:TolC family outer membrane protein [Acinetobacter sp. SwsAc6]|jgi:outer membrane protein|uniref:multidrug efflux outer membrane protein AbuO n=1 Tax=Acinetobacter TaxID=469 RepID=UPI000D11F47A|nr:MULTISPECIES: TolC family outer membrane protein [Acinetobacter]NWK72748.1 TolC family outer membrane protein [Acinetobacter sp. SwsAc6]QCO20532.1 TolC family outer membrane protein [Acinetobacter cumulans]RFS33336.1 RND transporter [Acinetobacter sp. SWAC5]RKG46033.1 RND transporter [Acinetobacter cumulans]RZG61330.1 RND transporter [Acinetobacter sp. WCHAc060006]
MKINYLLCTCALFLSPWATALDLVDAYERAKQSDPTWQANQLQYKADQLNLGIASGNLLPTISLSGNVTRKNQGENTSGASAGLNMPSSVTSKQIALTARQPLFRWDAWEGLKQVKTSINLSEISLRLQRQDHILNVADSYFNVLRQQALTVANLQEEKALSEQLKMMDAKLKEGLVAKSDVSEANAQYQNARANRMATQVQLVLAQEKLQQMIGPYTENLAVLRDDFEFQKPVPSSMQAWEDLAMGQNLGILQARMQQRYAEDKKRVEKAALYPQIEAVGTYGYAKQSPNSIMSQDGQFNQVGVEMNWNLYTGGRTQKSIKQAAVNVQKSEAELDAAVRKATTDVKQAYMQVDTDQTKIQARKAAMESSATVSKASQAQYREGLKTMVDVLLAQRNAFSAKQDYLNTKYDYLVHVLKLKAAVGKLSETDLEEMNIWLSQPTVDMRINKP